MTPSSRGWRPGKRRRHLDGREIDLRQRRDGQQRIGDDSDEQDAGHQQRGRNRKPDERRRNAALRLIVRMIAGFHPYCAFVVVAASDTATLTVEPGCTLYWPATMTRSPALSPCSITVRPSTDAPTLSLRISALLSAFTA